MGRRDRGREKERGRGREKKRREPPARRGSRQRGISRGGSGRRRGRGRASSAERSACPRGHSAVWGRRRAPPPHSAATTRAIGYTRGTVPVCVSRTAGHVRAARTCRPAAPPPRARAAPPSPLCRPPIKKAPPCRVGQREGGPASRPLPASIPLAGLCSSDGRGCVQGSGSSRCFCPRSLRAGRRAACTVTNR